MRDEAFDGELRLVAFEDDAGKRLQHDHRRAGADAHGGEPLGTGVVASVGVAVDTGSRAVPVRVTVTSPRRALRLGESVYGVVAAGTRPGAVVVPAEALVPGDAPGTFRVFVVDRNGIAHARDVSVGGRTESEVEITQGLTGGETVVTQGAFGVQDSARVRLPAAVTPAAIP